MDRSIIVNESCANLRALGRDALKGKWGLGVAGTLLYIALTTVPVIILNAIFGHNTAGPSGISTVYNLLISGPMTLGYAMFAISIFRKRETSAAEVFYGFERFGKAFGLYIVMTVLILLWSLLLLVPGIIAAFRYSMSFYILADHPEMGIMETINESKRMMAGNKWKYFCLNLSFIGWGILCIFTLGIGFLWLGPYVQVTAIAFYDIANGSLRSVKSIEGGYGPMGDSGITGEDNGRRSGEDRITVYKEEPETMELEGPKSSGPESEPAEPDEKEPEKLIEEPEALIEGREPEVMGAHEEETPKNEE